MDSVNHIQEGYYSTETKVKRPYIAVAEAPALIPKHKLFSDKEAKQRLNSINNDIYEGTKKEKSKHDFNNSLYFKIFGGVCLTAAGIAGVHKIRKFFNKS